MAKGSSKVGNRGNSTTLSNYLKMNREQQGLFLLRAIETQKVPDGIKDNPTQRLMVALGMNGKPTVVSDDQLDKENGIEMFRTFNDSKNMTSQQIYDQIINGSYTSLSDQNGSSEGRGLYFSTEVNGSIFWGDQKSNDLTMRAKLTPGTKTIDLMDCLRDLNNETSYRHGREIRKKEDPYSRALNSIDTWDAVSIHAITKGYKAITSYDHGTGYDVVVMLDRSAMKVSSKTKKVPKSIDTKDISKFQGKQYNWNDLKLEK